MPRRCMGRTAGGWARISKGRRMSSPCTPAARGWASRALAAPLARVRHAGHVYAFGLLFGLGFKKYLVDPMAKHGVLPLAIATMALSIPPERPSRAFLNPDFAM